VKRKTLWHYEDLIRKLLNVLAYDFVQEHYNHGMGEAEGYSERVRQGYLQNGQEAASLGEITEHLNTLGGLRIRDYLDLVQRVGTRETCASFLHQTDFGFEPLIQTLNYLFRWVLPFELYLRELIDVDNDDHKAHLDTLKQHKLKSNLDILERCRTRTGRAELSRGTGIPETFILDLVHKADVSRLAYVRGKTVRHLCGGGYDTLDSIANVDLKKMEQDMAAYYRTIGKRFSDFKTVIPLGWMIGGAKILPRVIEE
jgi:hypothetical protein